jgi:hypothetical protein
MKRIFLIIAAICITSLMQAQRTDPIDEFFDRYSERDGFTTVTISGKLLGLFAGKNENREGSDIINRLTSIKILSVDDSLMNNRINFYNELRGKIDLSAYEELMDVKEGKNTTKFLIKQKGDNISDLILISGGPNGNTLISIKGNLDLKSLSELSEGTGIDELKDLEKIDDQKRKQ